MVPAAKILHDMILSSEFTLSITFPHLVLQLVCNLSFLAEKGESGLSDVNVAKPCSQVLDSGSSTKWSLQFMKLTKKDDTSSNWHWEHFLSLVLIVESFYLEQIL